MALQIFTPNLGVEDIPNFLRARSAAGLRRAMLKNNLKHKAFVQYFDIQFNEAERVWYAWYFSNLSRDENQSIEDQVNLARSI